MGIHEFWMQVYIAAIGAGGSSTNAKFTAHGAVKSFRAQFAVIGHEETRDRIFNIVQLVLNRWYSRGTTWNPEQLACEVIEALYPEVRPADAAPSRPHE